jgi:peptide/nickel transport system substrate-binding protein
MAHHRRSSLLALGLVFMLVAAACAGGGGGDGGEEPAAGQPQKGGSLVWESEEFGFTNGFDPTGEYLGQGISVMTNMLTRTLIGTRHVAGNAGNEAVPDLAADVPEISDDGLTYTFTLRDGVMFGPPVDREVTSKDVLYAFERIGTESLVAQYGFYYDDAIEGLADFKAGKADKISGIETPDDKTIIFHLTEPAGDFLYRLALPATAPIPEEVGKCFTKAGEYGRFVISSGPYMIEGSEDLDISSCKAMKPISGYDPTKQMALVRNPNYDQSTDEYRDNWVDRWEHVINTNTNDLEQRVNTGENDFVYTPTPQTLRSFATDPELKQRLYIDSADRTWYITLNAAQPPFDDIHVRKAANLVMDKDGLRRAWGGPTQGDIATHIVPDVMLNGLLEDYDPYPSPNFAGDVAAAKEEMRKSKYDSDADGVCDDPACKNLLQVSSNTPPNVDMMPIVEASLEKIGITLEVREVTDAYTPIQTVAREIPISARPGWGKDYPDAYTFLWALFDSDNILCTGNTNYSLVGLTPQKAKECGIDFKPVPSVDKDIEKCIPLQGDERVQCWADLDKKVMEEIVPWVPYLDATAVWATSEDVTKYEFDQFSGDPAWSNIAVAPSGQ